MSRRSAIALIDGEHYPAVVADALNQMGDRFEFRAALFLGGSEKVDIDVSAGVGDEVYGLAVSLAPDCEKGLADLIDRYRPEVVVDLSDEPVLGYERRFRLISHSLARNVGYVGSDFHFSPASTDRLCSSPSLSIVGTGKRVGKTAITGYVARVLRNVVIGREGHPGLVVVAMGRGGPAEPEVIHGEDHALRVSDLLAYSRRGRHAASDHIEEAVLSRVTTIGCRRCGGGMAGQPMVSNAAAGTKVANTLEPGLIILEGSGAALPPVGSDARMLVVGASQSVEHVAGFLGAYRILTSDAVVLTMAEPPLASEGKVRTMIKAIRDVKPGMTTIPVLFRPNPDRTVDGRRVAFFSTAPRSQETVLKRHLAERWGCKVEIFSSDLADRAALRAVFRRPEMGLVDAVLTEIKAAAVDIVAEEAEARGLEVVFVDNEPFEVPPASPGRLRELAVELADRAKERFEREA